MSTTFKVNDVRKSNESLMHEDAVVAIDMLLGQRFEPERFSKQIDSQRRYAFIDAPSALISSAHHPFAHAVMSAFNAHLPLVLSPDHIWTLILQGLGLHVNEHAEDYRHLFVTHPTEMELTIEPPMALACAPEVSWHEMVHMFCDEIELYTKGALLDFIDVRFSTTGPLASAVFRATLMNMVKAYFEYRMDSICGIPEVTLLGTVDDWVELRYRTDKLRDYNMAWWRDDLVPILDQFLNASKGHVDLTHWQSFVQFQSMSGGDRWRGWFTKLFPYSVMGPEHSVVRCYPSGIDSFPGGLCSTPFTWDTVPMLILSGFVGCTQNEAGQIKPEVGMAICYK